MPERKLGEKAFKERFLQQFDDPEFDVAAAAIDDVMEVAWKVYDAGRKAPRTQPAGPGFSDPEYQISLDWLNARAAILEAERYHADPGSPSTFLVINGSPRTEFTCPGEMSKSFRLVEIAVAALRASGNAKCTVLDLSRLTSEYGRHIYPCKGCFSTSPALCHWPCSCYPNHGLGQVQDWMNEIYPMWVEAHGVMIITPTHWYQAPTVLKAMIDRLVCAEGGNPDPSSTHGKNAEKAKGLEDGWSYPRHLAGRIFSVVVHGDTAGIESLRRCLTDWLTDMQLRPAGSMAILDRYIGYYEPYGSAHAALDADQDLFAEVRNAASTLLEAVRRYRCGERAADENLSDPRPK